MKQIKNLFQMTRATLILVGVLVATIFVMNRCSDKKDDDYAELEVENQLLKKEVKVSQDSEGRWRATAQAMAVNGSTIKALSRNESIHYSKLHEDFEGLRKSLKNLNNHTSTHTETIVPVETIIHDTVYIQKDGTEVAAKRIYWKDDIGYNSFRGSLVDSVLFGELKIKDSLEVVVYWKRKHKIIGKKIYHTEVLSKNPSTKIIHVETLVQKAK